jgi:hypothetical protein
MQCEIELSDIEEFLGTMMPQLNEKQRRYFLASFSKLMGRGSVTKLSEMTGVSAVTISKARQRSRPSRGIHVHVPRPMTMSGYVRPVLEGGPQRRSIRNSRSNSNPFWRTIPSATP